MNKSLENIRASLSKSQGCKLINGEMIPILGNGSWDTHEESACEATKVAIENGVRLFDTAFVYKNEKYIGKAIRDKIDEGVIERDDIFIMTKLWNTFHRPDLVKEACMKSLKDLGLEYIDLYLMHNPYAFQEGDDFYPRDKDNELIPSNVDFCDTWREMEKLVQCGLTRSIGVSNFNELLQLIRLLKLCDLQPAAIQFECHPFLTQFRLSEFCKNHNIAIIAYGPLGSPERPIQFTGEPKLLCNHKVISISVKYKKSPAQILIRYQIQRGHIAIPKSETLQFIRENVNVFDFQITDDDMDSLNRLNIHRRFVSSLSCMHLAEYPFRDDIRYGNQQSELKRC